jgi:hypothetical protein
MINIQINLNQLFYLPYKWDHLPLPFGPKVVAGFAIPAAIGGG